MQEVSSKTPFEEWFNINNKDHLKALSSFIKGDSFPAHFLPADVEFTDKSIDAVYRKIADAWIKSHTGPLTRDAFLEG